MFAFYSDAASEQPVHVSVYTGTTAKNTDPDTPCMSGNYSGSAQYTACALGTGSSAKREIRRYHVSETVSVPLSFESSGSSGSLKLTASASPSFTASNHVTDGAVSIRKEDVISALPETDYTNADFSRSRAVIELSASMRQTISMRPLQRKCRSARRSSFIFRSAMASSRSPASGTSSLLQFPLQQRWFLTP